MSQKEWFSDQIRTHEKAMYHLAYSIVGSEADAMDAVSEAIYRAYSRLDTLQSRASFKTWILSIVHNAAVDLIRTNSRTCDLEEAHTIPEAEPGVDLTTRLALRHAVEGLGQPYRTVVVLYYYEELSVSRIAQITGAQPAAVRQQLSRARKMLKELLKEDFSHGIH